MKSFLALLVLFGVTVASPLAEIDFNDIHLNDEDISELMSIQNRIAGGEVAQPNQFPYQAALYMRMKDRDGKPIEGGSWCGGSLISNRFILTAAHCLFVKEGATIFLGLHNISKPELGLMSFKVNRTKFIIHDDYDPNIAFNDIGLIKLPEKIEFTKKIAPIKMASKDMTQDQIEGKTVIASGWGKTGDDGFISRVLRFVKRTVLPHKPCREHFPKSYRQRKEICVDGSDAKSVCGGDSGGPLVMEDANGERTLIGLTSFGSRHGCSKGFPTVFTRVSAFRDWITQFTGKL
uniref:Venom polypeptide n=1 Tax=Dolopus genitalis TaxID=2488630 RepID=A0A3G5BIG4_DOLGE|nr:venom polypeptide [Dolopus genitalis]